MDSDEDQERQVRQPRDPRQWQPRGQGRGYNRSWYDSNMMRSTVSQPVTSQSGPIRGRTSQEPQSMWQKSPKSHQYGNNEIHDTWQPSGQGYNRPQYGSNVMSTVSRPMDAQMPTISRPVDAQIKPVKGILKTPQVSQSRWEQSPNSDGLFPPPDNRAPVKSQTSSTRAETSPCVGSSRTIHISGIRGQSLDSHNAELMHSPERLRRLSQSPSRSPTRGQSSSGGKPKMSRSHKKSKHKHKKSKKRKRSSTSLERSPYERSPRKRQHSGSGYRRSRSRSPVRSSASSSASSASSRSTSPDLSYRSRSPKSG